jgi:5,10-methylenetetrahydromethanopterin reductase
VVKRIELTAGDDTDGVNDRTWQGTGLALAGSVLERRHGRHIRVRRPFEELVEAVAMAEQTGYRTVWVPDHGLWEPFSVLAALAQRSSAIGLATGVVTTPTRDPGAMASAASTLAEVSGARFALGLGSGPESRVGRIGAYVAELSDRLGDIPVFLAGLGPRMVDLAGRVADGVILNWCTPARVRRARHRLPDKVTVAVYVRACLGHDQAHALEALRPHVAMYASLPAYRRQLEAEGLGELAQAAADAGRREDDREVPEELVDTLCIRGGRDEATARLDQYRAAGADLVVVYPVTAQDPASSLMGTIMAAAPDPSVEA